MYPSDKLLHAILFFESIALLELFKKLYQIQRSEQIFIYHSSLSLEEREIAASNWKNSKVQSIMLATSSFIMGIDNNKVRVILNVGICGGMIMFLQAAGRAARDGSPSSIHSITVSNSKDQIENEIKRIDKQSDISEAVKRGMIDDFVNYSNYLQTTQCLRGFICEVMDGNSEFPYC